jgi:uncharacterized protein (TIGR03437 family)
MKNLFLAFILTIAGAAISSGQITVVSGASFDSDSVLAPGSIASAFGTNLAPNVEIASTSPLPLALQGIRVTVTDLALQTKECPLFFVSPSQINFLIPEGLAVGPATVRVRPAAALSEEGVEQATQQGTITLAAVVPGFFKQTDLDWAAGFLIRVKTDGTQVRESMYYAPEGQIVPRPLQLSPGGDETEQFYIELYGTGIRNVGGAANVTTLVGNLAAAGGFSERDIVPTLYAGLAPGLEGVDQVTAGPLNRGRLEAFGGSDSPMALVTATRGSNTVWMRIQPNPNAPSISNAFFRLVPGTTPQVQHAFDFQDADGDLGPAVVVISWEDATQVCTTVASLPAGPFTGQTSGRFTFASNKGGGTTELGAIVSAVISVSDARGHISNLISFFPEPAGSMPGFRETCFALEPK